MELKTHNRYLCRIKVRSVSPRGAAMKPEMAALNGREFVLRPMWQGDDDDRYPSEWAMMLEREDEKKLEGEGIKLTWIASGDVEVLREVER